MVGWERLGACLGLLFAVALSILTNTWYGYSYSGDPGVATGYGVAEFPSATYWDGWLTDNSAQGYELMLGRPVLGALPGLASMAWYSPSSGRIWQGVATVRNAPGGFREISFEGPGGPIIWIVEPGQ